MHIWCCMSACGVHACNALVYAALYALCLQESAGAILRGDLLSSNTSAQLTSLHGELAKLRLAVLEVQAS